MASLARNTIDHLRLCQQAPTEAWVYDDGGRAAAGYRGHADDCVCRAIVIAAQLPYQQVYEDLAHRNAAAGKARSARDGVLPKVIRAWFADNGWLWTPTMQIGSGCQVHLLADELPPGRIVARLSRHLVAVVDGVVRDTHDPSRDGTRCVYGLWEKP